MKRNKQRLPIIRSAESENVSIPANSTVALRCITSKELDYHPTCAMLVPTDKSVLTDDCNITPAVVHYTFGKSKRKAMNRNWCNQKANPALNTKAGNK